jgi:hypothetical protein
VQNNVGAVRRGTDCGVIEGVDFVDLRSGDCVRRRARSNQAGDRPTCVPECLRGGMAEAPAGAENQNARAHDCARSQN